MRNVGAKSRKGQKDKASPKRYNILKITNIKQFMRFILFFFKNIPIFATKRNYIHVFSFIS